MPQDQEANASSQVTEPTSCEDVQDADPVIVAVVDVKQSKEKVVAGSPEKSQNTYQCGFCNGFLGNKQELVSHNCFNKPNVNVLFECQECKTLFQTLDALACHMTAHEQHVLVLTTDNQPGLTRLRYRCSLCDKYLSSKGSLVKHQQLHQGLKPFLCNFCNKSFSLKGNRDKHELIHAGERPHKCSICEKSFTLKGNLQQHMLTHTSLKLYKCPICGNEFTLKGNLSKHMKRHENGWKKKEVKSKSDTEEGCSENAVERGKVLEAFHSLSKHNVAKSKPVQETETVSELSEPIKTALNIHLSTNKVSSETISGLDKSKEIVKKVDSVIQVETVDGNKQLEPSVYADSAEEKRNSVEQIETKNDNNRKLNVTLN